MNHLRHWEIVSDHVEKTMEFIEWLETEYDIRLDWDYAAPGSPLSISQLIDQFYEVDRKALDIERRTLLTRHQRSEEGNQ